MIDQKPTTHNNPNPMHDEETVLAWLMDALDGTLPERDQQLLQMQLTYYPALAQEWEALQRVDALFTAAPSVAPPVHFASQTMALLPNLALRRTLSAALFTLLFLGGLLPFLAVVGLGAVLVSGGTAVSALFTLLGSLGQFSTVLLGAMSQLLLGMGAYLGQNPAVVGTLMVMIGSIFLWAGVYRQLVSQPQLA